MSLANWLYNMAWNALSEFWKLALQYWPQDWDGDQLSPLDQDRDRDNSGLEPLTSPHLSPEGHLSFAVWGPRTDSEVAAPSKGVRGWAPAAQRLSCALRSPGSLFCWVIKGKQLQKRLDLAAKRVAPTPLGAGVENAGNESMESQKNN